MSSNSKPFARWPEFEIRLEWPGFLLRAILAKIAKIEKKWKKDRQIDKQKKKTNERRGHTCADQIDAPQR